MKSLHALFYTGLFLLYSLVPDYHDVEKMGMLFSHFREHQTQNPEISFGEFLFLHYLNTTHQQQDPQTHERLPFGHSHHCAIGTITLINDFYQLSIQSPEWNQVTPQEFYREHFPASAQATIWQPPKAES